MSVQETLSAMLDDEAQDLELRRVLRAVDDEPELRQRWHRQLLARAAMHGEPLYGPCDLDLAARVAAAIDAEPIAVSGQGGWRRAVGGMAIAASVTAVAVFGGSQWMSISGDSAAARVGPLPVGVVNSVGAVPVQASFGTRSLPAVQGVDSGAAYRELARQRLRRYSQEHAEHAALNTPAGMVPFARVPVIEP